jgi:hypothetical protein
VLAHQLEVYAGTFLVPGRRYGTLVELVLDLGTWHTAAPLPAELQSWRGPDGACYINSARLADAMPSLRYVEGFANPGLAHSLPLEHAWCVDEQDVVHDPTWEVNGDCAYLGVPLRPGFRAEALQRPRRFPSTQILDVYADPSLLFEGVPVRAVAWPPGVRSCSRPVRHPASA